MIPACVYKSILHAILFVELKKYFTSFYVLCVDRARTYRRFDIVIRQGLRTLVVSEGAAIATWNGFSTRAVKAIWYKMLSSVSKNQ